MLIFTRKRHEAIMIGDTEVRVLRVGRDGVRLGVEAAATVPVHRREIYDRIREENQHAAAAAAAPASLVRLRSLLTRRAQAEGPA